MGMNDERMKAGQARVGGKSGCGETELEQEGSSEDVGEAGAG